MKVAIVGDVHLTLRKYKEFEENRFKLLIDEKERKDKWWGREAGRWWK